MSGISIEEFMKLNDELIDMKGQVYEKQESVNKLTKEITDLKNKLTSSEGTFEATTSQMQLLKDELRNADSKAQASETKLKGEIDTLKKDISAIKTKDNKIKALEDYVTKLKDELASAKRSASSNATSPSSTNSARLSTTPSIPSSPMTSSTTDTTTDIDTSKVPVDVVPSEELTKANEQITSLSSEISKLKKDIEQRDNDITRVMALYASEQQKKMDMSTELEAALKATKIHAAPKPPASAPPQATAAQAQAHREQVASLKREIELLRSTLSEERGNVRVAGRRLRALASSVVELRMELSRAKEASEIAETKAGDAVTVAERVLSEREVAHDSAMHAARTEAERVSATLRSRIAALEEITTRSSDTGARLMNDNKTLLLRAMDAESQIESLSNELEYVKLTAENRERELQDEIAVAKSNGIQRGLSAAELRKQLRREVSESQRLALMLRVCIELHPDLKSVVDETVIGSNGSSGNNGGSGNTHTLSDANTSKSNILLSESDSATSTLSSASAAALKKETGELANIRDLEFLRTRIQYLENSNALLQTDLEEKKALVKTLIADYGNTDGRLSTNSTISTSDHQNTSFGSPGSSNAPSTPSKISKRMRILSYMGVGSSAPNGSPQKLSPVELEARNAQALLTEYAVRTDRMKADMARLGEEIEVSRTQLKTMTLERDQLKELLHEKAK